MRYYALAFVLVGLMGLFGVAAIAFQISWFLFRIALVVIHQVTEWEIPRSKVRLHAIENFGSREPVVIPANWTARR